MAERGNAPPSLPNKPLLRPQEVAPFLYCTDRNVRKLFNEGKLKGERKGPRKILIYRHSVLDYQARYSEFHQKTLFD